MNRKRHLNKYDRKRRTCLNDCACQNVDYNHTARQHFQHQLLDRSACDRYSLGSLNSDRLNVEVDSVPHCDLLTLHNRKAGGCPSESYQGRTVSNVNGYQGHQNLGNRKKKKKKNCGLGSVHTISPCTAVPASTEDGAAGLVNRQLRSIGFSSGWQDRTEMQHTQPNTFRKEPFSTDDHFVSPATAVATVATTEKVFHLNTCIY